MADVQQEDRTPVALFRLMDETVWHIESSEDHKAVCGVEPLRHAGSGTQWTVRDAKPSPVCGDCVGVYT